MPYVEGGLLDIHPQIAGFSAKLWTLVTISTSKAEWTAMVHGVRHAIFIRGILGEMGCPAERIPWFWDNRGTIQAASRISFGGRTKHVNIKLKCTREYVGRG